MRISLNWLSDLVEVRDPDTLRGALTFAGLEVEAVERRGEGLSKVVVARILSSTPHPKADKLSVVEADAGGKPLQIVCGAKNYKVGDLVPLALPGAVLPGGVQIAEADLRGVKSSGMLCSQRELGLSDAPDAHAGLWILPSGSPGQPLTDAMPIADTVFEINVTPNRGDCLSHLGIAREVAALTGVQRKAQVPAPRASRVDHALAKPAIADASRCASISFVPLQSGSDLGAPSPFWMQARLLACGVRPLGLAIDVTNYVMLELGQPLHAYDLDKLKSGIVVRLARAKESLETLDGQKRELSTDDLLICDGEVPVGLAGVMGGASTRVLAGTKRIYLEAAAFTPSGIRRAAKRHALPSEASHRFERGVDPALPEKALARAVALLEAATQGTSAGPVERIELTAPVRRQIAVSFKRVEQILGLPVPADEVFAKLAAIEVPALSKDAGRATFEIPTHRSDLTTAVDVISEIGRLISYSRIPPRPPRRGFAAPATASLEALRSQLRTELVASGFCEAISYSFIAGPIASAFGGAGTPVRLVNPLKHEHGELRRSLLPSLCEALQRNLAHLTRDAGVPPTVKLFEIASVYRWPAPGEVPEGPASESPRLAFLWHGPRFPLGWGAGRELADVHDLRAILERLFDRLRVPFALRPADVSSLHPRSAAQLWSGERILGTCGELHPGLAKALDLPRQLLLCEIDLEACQLTSAAVRQAEAPKFPAVLRDIALVVSAETPAEQMATCLKEAGGTLLEALTLFDCYQGPPLAASDKSLAYSLRFRAKDRTLVDADVAGLHEAMVAAAGAKFGAKLRT